MTEITRTRLACTGIALAAMLALTACNKPEDTTPGEKLDNAIERSEQAASDAATTSGQALENAAQDASAAAKDAGAAIKEGAASVGQAASEAATNVEAALDDAGITARIKADLAKDSELSALAINVDTKGGAVTLHGKAPSAEAKERAETMAKGVQGVTSVDNQLTVE
jgi:osmotically-inducible protein OsmY